MTQQIPKWEELVEDTDIWNALALYFHSEGYEGDVREYIIGELQKIKSKLKE